MQAVKRFGSEPGGASGEAALSIIAAGTSIVGEITSEGSIRLEGHLKGTLRARQAVIVGATGVLEGDIDTQDAQIAGEVTGSIVASGKLKLERTCKVDGEIQSRDHHLTLEQGARFTGVIRMAAEALEGAKSNPHPEKKGADTRFRVA